MPPRLNSRYESSFGRFDDDGNLFLTLPEPFRWDPDLTDTRQHEVGEGDTLEGIAYEHFKALARAMEDRRDGWGPEHLWWIICDFQPVPIMDPTLSLEVGRVLEIPSDEVVQDRIFGR